MPKLTKEQIHKLRELLIAMFGHSHSPIQDHEANEIAAMVQYPIEPPTEEELKQAWEYYQNFQDRIDTHILTDFEDVMKHFVARRNAALLPKPDPRREKIIDKMKQVRDSRDDVVRDSSDAHVEVVLGKYADAILKALDEAGHDDQ